jgi:hypothetical protein
VVRIRASLFRDAGCVGGGSSNPHLDKEIHVLDFLSGQEREDLQEFLKSLTGELPADVGPPSKSGSGASK